VSARWLGLVLAVYAPHLVEEAFVGMHHDRLIVAASAPLAHLSAPARLAEGGAS
jgi:hypothetical protein